jgi:polar amino acid transport system substrate-binding protein
MLQSRLIRMLLLLGVLGLGAALAFAACGDDEASPTVTAGPTDDGGSDTSAVPELDDGVLTIGSDIAYAPIEFYIEGTETPDGLDVDIAKAIAEVLGIDVEFVNAGFDGLILSLQSEDFDAVMSAMTITEEREQEIDFVPYANVGAGIVVPAGNPDDVQELEDLCGLAVAVQAGTIYFDMLETQNESCTEKINIVTFDTNPLAVEDLKTGGSDANLSDFPVAFVDADESDGALEVLDVQIDPAPYGIGVRKESPELAALLLEALAAIKASGEYDDILAKWKLSAAALE